MNRKIFVDNFAPSTTVQMLRDHFTSAGAIESVVIPPRASIRDISDHAFILMETEAGAFEAIRRFNNSSLNGSRLTVTSAGPITRVSSGFHGGPPRLRPKS